MEEVLLDNGTQQAVYELASLVITAVVTILGIYIRNFINTNKTIAKYNFDNERTERLLTNAILFAENKAKQMAKDGINKRDLSIKYLDDISPDVVKQNGDKLQLMLDRKLEELRAKKLVQTPTSVVVEQK